MPPLHRRDDDFHGGQVVRDLLADAIGRRQQIADLDASELADRLAADVAEARRRLAG